MKLWVDDMRPAPEGWTRAYDYHEATHLIMLCLPTTFEAISLDHDLGLGLTGYDLAKWMVAVEEWPKDIYFHTANPVGRFNMQQLLSHYAPEGVTVHE